MRLSPLAVLVVFYLYITFHSFERRRKSGTETRGNLRGHETDAE